jgi:hypothetical protein
MQTDITTGTQTVTTTGAITGSLDTSALIAAYTVKAKLKLDKGVAIVALEDTANASAFSDAVQVAIFNIHGPTPAEGDVRSVREYQIPGTRFGAANTKLRFNVLAIAGGGTLTTWGWLEQ